MTGINVFELAGLNENASSIEIQEKIEEIKKRSSRYKDKSIFDRIITALELYKKRAEERERIEELAKEGRDLSKKNIVLSDEVQEALDYFSDDSPKVERPLNKKKKFRLKKGLIIAGAVLVLITGGNKIIDNIKAKDMQNNVCIEYTVQAGDTFDWVDEHIRDYSTIRTQNIGADFRYDYLYKGDLIIGRTTMETAKELEEKGYARIISVEEAIDIVEISGGRLYGKLDDYKENNLEDEVFVFFEPEKTFVI